MVRKLCFFLFILLSLCSYTVDINQELNSDFDKEFQQCISFIRKDNLDELYSCLTTLEKKFPNTSEYNKSKLYSYFGFYFRKNKKFEEALDNYQKALSFLEQYKNEYLAYKISVYGSIALIYAEVDNETQNLFYLKKALSTALVYQDSTRITNTYNNLGVFYDKKNQDSISLRYYKKALVFKTVNNDSLLIFQNLGSSYIGLKKIDSAKYYLNKVVKASKDSTTLSLAYFNLSKIEELNNNRAERIKYLKQSEKYLINSGNLQRENNLNVFKDLSEIYKAEEDYKKSLFYNERYNELNNFLINVDVKKNLNQLRTKYQTEKKENENLQLKQQNQETEAKRKQILYLLIAALLILIAGSAIYYVSLKSSKRKRKLAEQQKELEKQKNLTLLKEQEITTINAMIEGQEKERLRIAEDLHDNIGSVLATLKLHFENLKLNREKKHFNQEELYKKTENLIDETYLKVRKIAHAKNSGVIANQGLLVAIKMMAEKISSADSIQIEVIDFGLDKRLENNLEITIFRIIQELVTNVLKHAYAKSITINISLFENNLNVIIEDDGVGFDTKNIKDNGIGLSSIKTRIQHLKGKIDIDSTLTKGTTIIINIPI